jgi:hypothetical protein
MASNMNSLINIVNSMVPPDTWVFGGSVAIDMWCLVLGIQLPEQHPNNIDILYAKMTPTTIARVGSYICTTDMLRSSITYTSPEFTPINVTMTRNNIKYYEVEGIKILTPISLLSWYEDMPDLYQEKIDLLKQIISHTASFEFKYIYLREPRYATDTESSAKRRMFQLLIS